MISCASCTFEKRARPGADDSGLFTDRDNGVIISKRKHMMTNTEIKRYLRNLRPELGFAVLLFVLACLLAQALVLADPAGAEQYFSLIKGKYEAAGNMTPEHTFFYIFQNNFEVMLSIIGFGALAGILPLLFLVLNGSILGLTTTLVAQKTSWIVVAAAVLPHGIIEIPALLIAAAIGLRIGRRALSVLWRRDTGLVEETAAGIRLAFWVLAPALLVAAFIESFVTPMLLVAVNLGLGG